MSGVVIVGNVSAMSYEGAGSVHPQSTVYYDEQLNIAARLLHPPVRVYWKQVAVEW